jgi:hypothetical protein
MRLSTLAAAATLLATTNLATASTSVFFGEDLNNSAFTPLASTPNASAAEADFLSNLQGVGTEDFEGFADGSGEPLNLTFPGSAGAIVATLSGGNGAVNSVPAGSTNTAGRYGTSPTNYWEVAAGGANNFTVTFDQTVAAFGFYGIDIGDFGGQLELQVTRANSVVETITVNNTQGSFGSTDGSVLFFGIIETDAAAGFDSIEFLTSTGQGDIFAFDDFTVGDIEQINAVPVPAAMPLLLGGLGAFALIRRRG